MREHKEFSRRFGPFAEDAYTVGVRGHPEVQPVIKEADDTSAMVFGSGWHTDSPFLPEPPAISTLRAVEVPPFGGDTLWANCRAGVSHAERHHAAHARGVARAFFHARRARLGAAERRAARHAHRPARGHARAGAASRKSLRSRCAATRIRWCARIRSPARSRCTWTVPMPSASKGWRPAEAAPLLRFLVEHITQPAFTCRLRWEPGTLTLWDNRLCVTRHSTTTPAIAARCIAPRSRASARAELQTWLTLSTPAACVISGAE